MSISYILLLIATEIIDIVYLRNSITYVLSQTDLNISFACLILVYIVLGDLEITQNLKTIFEANIPEGVPLSLFSLLFKLCIKAHFFLFIDTSWHFFFLKWSVLLRRQFYFHQHWIETNYESHVKYKMWNYLWLQMLRTQ